MKIGLRRVQIRPLRAEDAALWRDLRLEALALHPDAYGSTHDDWSGRPLADFAARLTDGHVLAAFLGGDLVGSMALDASDADPKRGELTAVYVRPEFRGRGIAKRLLRRAASSAKSAGMTHLTLTVAEANETAFAFYTAHKFIPDGLDGRALIRDGRLLDLIRMVRPL